MVRFATLHQNNHLKEAEIQSEAAEFTKTLISFIIFTLLNTPGYMKTKCFINGLWC